MDKEKIQELKEKYKLSNRYDPYTIKSNLNDIITEVKYLFIWIY